MYLVEELKNKAESQEKINLKYLNLDSYAYLHIISPYLN